jgi:RNA polymerase sigma factor (TIGR02999 family)
MSTANPEEITRLLSRMRAGDRSAQDELLPLIYDTLHRLAANCMRHERRDHTLQPTALVNEVYLRLLGHDHQSWENRAHFFAIASQTMRRLLVDYARARLADKRGGRRDRVELDERLLFAEDHPEELLALDEALKRLREMDERQAQVVDLRFFGGLSVEQAAEVLNVSPKTVKRDWAFARAWLRGEVSGTGK